jgi:hypothetical protein
MGRLRERLEDLESSLAAIDTDRQEPAEPSPPGKKEE